MRWFPAIVTQRRDTGTGPPGRRGEWRGTGDERRGTTGRSPWPCEFRALSLVPHPCRAPKSCREHDRLLLLHESISCPALPCGCAQGGQALPAAAWRCGAGQGRASRQPWTRQVWCRVENQRKSCRDWQSVGASGTEPSSAGSLPPGRPCRIAAGS